MHPSGAAWQPHAYVVGIDQGTTGTRCILFDREGRPAAAAYAEHRQIIPQPGWVEHDPDEIWTVTARVIAEALGRAGVASRSASGSPSRPLLAALGIANQRETIVVWDRATGRPIYPAIVWQDTRTREQCDRLIRDGAAETITARTGLPVATYFSATKLAWLLDHVPGARAHAGRGDLCAGTIDTWLIWWLTGGPDGGVHVTDATNASRTMLMNLETRAWDPEALAVLRIPPAILPEIRPSSGHYGITRRDGPLGAAVPVCGALGDQQAALVGQACYRAGDTKNTYGTGCFLLQHTGRAPVRSAAGLVPTVGYAFPADVAYALEGSIAIAGAAVQWLRDDVGMIRTAEETAGLAASVPDAGGAYFVPAFSGLFAPYWDMTARGIIVGLTRYVTRAHLVRATLEAICYQTRDVVDAMQRDTGLRLPALRVDGGASRNDVLMQLQADLLGVPVVRSAVAETTALGAAYAAGLAQGVWDSLDAVGRHWSADRTFEPHMPAAERDARYAGWRRAVERSRGWAQEARD
ncbi:MAG TPA: glycerol kinase GlpK [bacterium]|nr:glycerol kinase GlpK [bacterium]